MKPTYEHLPFLYVPENVSEISLEELFDLNGKLYSTEWTLNVTIRSCTC